MFEKRFDWPQLGVRVEDIKPEGYPVDTLLPINWMKQALHERESDTYHAVDTPTRLSVILFREAGGVHVRGKMEFTLAHVCGWCLKTISEKRIIELDTIFLPAERFMQKGQTMREAEEDLGVFLFENGELYLHQFLAEEILLNIPVYPVVPTDEGHRCTRCGLTLAEVSGQRLHEEPPRKIDARWEKLKHIKIK